MRPSTTDGTPTTPRVRKLPDLGNIVRARRKASGIRIDDAAALSGVSVDLLSRLENGNSGVSTDRVLKVLDALGLQMLVVDKSKVARVLAALGAQESSGGR